MDQSEGAYDVIIVGAGPAGASCALALSRSDLKVCVIDKAVFPRDKICGDALSADVIKQLPLLSEKLATHFDTYESRTPSYGVRLFAPDRSSVDLSFTAKAGSKGYVWPRQDFDNLLVSHVKADGNCDFLEKVFVTDVSVNPHEVHVHTNQGLLRARMVVGADGANSVVARLSGNKAIDRRYHSAGLRVYYEGVEGFDDRNHIELHFFQSILPGYLWIFPMHGGRANVGIGMLSSVVAKKRINLRRTLEELLQTDPLLRKRFINARPLETVKGHGLPLGSVKRRLSGDRFLLVGDAASLIDPFTGEGVGNAIRSGRVAAEHVVRCFQEGNCSAQFNLAYDREIYRRMGKEFRISHALQRLCRIPWLFNLVVRKANNNPYWHEFLCNALADVNVKMRFTRPSFYYRLLFS
ncbi:MAG: geranylgeranyl reductase family protein [Bacteroidota bacterium]|nr:MAG: geranylgeranyl reductase [Bacteroidota bacterium]